MMYLRRGTRGIISSSFRIVRKKAEDIHSCSFLGFLGLWQSGDELNPARPGFMSHSALIHIPFHGPTGHDQNSKPLTHGSNAIGAIVYSVCVCIVYSV